MMTSREKHYFAHALTAEGYISLYPSLLKGLKRRYLLKGAPGTGKSRLIHEIGEAAWQKGYYVEFIHSPLNKEELDGVLIPALETAVIDASPPHSFDPVYPLIVDELINLDETVEVGKIMGHRDEITRWMDQMEDDFHQVHRHFAQAKKIHLQREALYREGMDISAADQVTRKLIDRFFSNVVGNPGEAKQRYMFFGAATANGVVHFIDQLTEGLDVRLILKGRPGSGKSTLISRLIEKGIQLGVETEVYRCSFDPYSVDMVVWPKLKVAVVDGIEPHDLEPVRPGDERLDLFELCFDQEIELRYSKELVSLNLSYKQETQQAMALLKQVKRYRDRLRHAYQSAVDQEQFNETLKRLKERIL